MISFDGVSCAYDGSVALHEISLTINRGEAVAILGPNGCGKSTLLKVINGIVIPDAGTFSFDGVEVTRVRLKDQAFSRRFHQRIGYLFQNPDSQLFCSSVRDEVAFGPRQMSLSDDEVNARVSDCMTLLGVEPLASRAPWLLSEGEKRKVAFASILSLNPDVLALDEPMNGIDPKTRRFLRDFIIRVHAAGKTILCATHDLKSVEGLFQSAIVISEDHRLARMGSYEEIVSDRAFMEASGLF